MKPIHDLRPPLKPAPILQSCLRYLKSQSPSGLKFRVLAERRVKDGLFAPFAKKTKNLSLTGRICCRCSLVPWRKLHGGSQLSPALSAIRRSQRTKVREILSRAYDNLNSENFDLDGLTTLYDNRPDEAARYLLTQDGAAPGNPTTPRTRTTARSATCWTARWNKGWGMTGLEIEGAAHGLVDQALGHTRPLRYQADHFFLINRGITP